MNKFIYTLNPACHKKSSHLLRVAVYARVSTDSNEQAESLEAQKLHYEHVIGARADRELAGIYYDEGISGTSIAKRKGLQQLLRDCRTGHVDRIVTKSISRFSRNTTDCLEMVRELQSLGVSLYFEKEDIDTLTMESELFLSWLSSLAEDESRTISQNVSWSIKKRFEQGSFKLASPPYGYFWDKEKLCLHPDQAPIVREIFVLALNGFGAEAIAKQLNDRHIPTQRNATWKSSTILSILRNEKYTGDVLLQKSYTDDHFKRHLNRGEKQQYLLTDHHDAIIDKQTFERVQDLLAKRAASRGIEVGGQKYQKRYLFSHRLICSHCGSYLKRQIRQTKTGPLIYWCCTKHLRDKKVCPQKSIPQSGVETAFILMMKKLSFASHLIIKPYVQALSKSVDEQDLNTVLQLQTELAGIRDKQQALIQLHHEQLIDAKLLDEEKRKLKLQEDDICQHIAAIEKDKAAGLSQIEEAKALLRLLDNKIAPDVFNDSLFERLVDHVSIHDKSSASFHLKAGLILKERM